MRAVLPIPIVIVAYRNCDDVLDCLAALRATRREPAFDVYICENGGANAYAELCLRLNGALDICVASSHAPPCDISRFVAHAAFGLKESDAQVFVGQAPENLGYGGGINIWLGPLLTAGEWPGAFILNPDAAPDADALAHLAAYARTSGAGMVTGRILLADAPHLVQTRGLKWNSCLASTRAVGRLSPADEKPDVKQLESELDSPSGAAFYVTRECIRRIGLLEERYFLYYEDLDWGLRAKAACGLGYAFDAVIRHRGGTTIGSGTNQNQSPFSTYMQFRNRLLFTAWRMPLWFPWTVALALLHALRFAAARRPANLKMALCGIRDGLLGKTGRPDRLFPKLGER